MKSSAPFRLLMVTCLGLLFFLCASVVLARTLPAKPNLTSAILARGLLAILMLFAWPGGAVRAMLYHLDGGDLRDWA